MPSSSRLRVEWPSGRARSRTCVGPTVPLMDEPFGALDAITKAALQDVLLNVAQQTDATIVFITHDLDEAIYLSDRVLVLSGSPGAVSLTAETEIPRPRDQLATRELLDSTRAGIFSDKHCGPMMADRTQTPLVGSCFLLSRSSSGSCRSRRVCSTLNIIPLRPT